MPNGSRWSLLKRIATATFRQYNTDAAPREAAALAYFGLFSLGPLILLATQFAEFFLDGKVVDAQLEYQLGQLLGASAAQTAANIISAASLPGSGSIWATVLGVVVLVFASTRAFFHLRNLLGQVLGGRPTEPPDLKTLMLDRAMALVMVPLLGALLLVSAVASWLVALLADGLERLIHVPSWVFRLFDWTLAPLLMFGALVVIYRVLPKRSCRWGDAAWGALLTTALISIGQVGMSLYLDHQDLGSSYGAAGSVVVLLLWFYLSAHAVMLGAELMGALHRYHRCGDPSVSPSSVNDC